MKAAWLSLGILIGYFIYHYMGVHETTVALLVICVITITISFLKAQKKEQDEKEERLRKHSWWN